jgi:hypothetical protein
MMKRILIKNNNYPKRENAIKLESEVKFVNIKVGCEKDKDHPAVTVGP